MTKRALRRILSAVLTAAMLASLLPPGFAAPADFEDQTIVYDGTPHGYTNDNPDNVIVYTNTETGETTQDTPPIDVGIYDVSSMSTVRPIALQATNTGTPLTHLFMLTITPRPLTLTTPSATKVYDGSALTQTPCITEEGDSKGLAEGDSLANVTATGSRTNAGSSSNTLTPADPTQVVIHNSTGKDVSRNYKIAYGELGILTILQRPVTITTPSAQKLYDGKPLTKGPYAVEESTTEKRGLIKGDSVTGITFTGTQTEPGSSSNTLDISNFSIRNSEKQVVTSNYSVSYQLGTLTVQPKPECILAQSATPANGAVVMPGQTITYSLHYRNNGQTDLDSIIITDPIPENTVFDRNDPTANPDGATYTTGADGKPVLSWNIGAVKIGHSGTVEFTVTVNKKLAAGTSIENSAQLAFDDRQTDSSTGHSTFLQAADPSTGTTVNAGNVIQYTLTYQNDNVSDKNNVIITDVIPENTTYLPGSASDSGSYDASSKKLTWDIGFVKAGETKVVDFQVHVNYGVQVGSVIQSNAQISVNGGKPVSSNEVEHSIPLAVSANPPSGTAVAAGQTIQYTLSYGNSSSTEQKDLVITNVIPANTTFDNTNAQFNPDGATYDKATNTLTWNIATVKPGTNGTVHFRVLVGDYAQDAAGNIIEDDKGDPILLAAPPAGVVIKNQGQSSVNGADAVNSNQTEHPTFVQSADPADGAELARGQRVTYHLTYTNDSMSTKQDVIITDVLPSHTTFDAADKNGSYADGRITWKLGDIAASESVSVTFSVIVNDDCPETVAASPATYLKNQAQVSTNIGTEAVPIRPVTTSNTVAHRIVLPAPELKNTAQIPVDLVPIGSGSAPGSVGGNSSPYLTDFISGHNKDQSAYVVYAPIEDKTVAYSIALDLSAIADAYQSWIETADSGLSSNATLSGDMTFSFIFNNDVLRFYNGKYNDSTLTKALQDAYPSSKKTAAALFEVKSATVTDKKLSITLSLKSDVTGADVEAADFSEPLILSTPADTFIIKDDSYSGEVWAENGSLTGSIDLTKPSANAPSAVIALQSGTKATSGAALDTLQPAAEKFIIKTTTIPEPVNTYRLTISNILQNAEGKATADPRGTVFSIKVTLGGKPYSGSYALSGVGVTSTSGSTSDGVIALKAGQTAQISGISPSTKYTIEEIDIPTDSVKTDPASDITYGYSSSPLISPLSGTISANVTATVTNILTETKSSNNNNNGNGNNNDNSNNNGNDGDENNNNNNDDNENNNNNNNDNENNNNGNDDNEDTAKPQLATEPHYAYIVGYPDGTDHPPVRPQGSITRAEVATIFFRLLTQTDREKYWSKANSFNDVPSGAWYNNAISTMANAGILSGYADSSFRPNQKVTRAELATIVSRFSDTTYNGADIFSDTRGHWAENAINVAATDGWIKGYNSGSFLPDQYVTRAETATLINRVLDRDEVSASSLLSTMKTWSDNMDPSAWYYLAIQEATNSHDCATRLPNTAEQWTQLILAPSWANLEKPTSNATDVLVSDVPA